jgi:hypothetical protein
VEPGRRKRGEVAFDQVKCRCGVRDLNHVVLRAASSAVPRGDAAYTNPWQPVCSNPTR